MITKLPLALTLFLASTIAWLPVSAEDGYLPASCDNRWQAGADLVLVQPYFSENPAFTTFESDGVSRERMSDRPFDYTLQASPRLWLGYEHRSGLGLRAAWWAYDHGADERTVSPPANGFGRIGHPDFGGVDISSTVPSDRMTFASSLAAHTIDLEVTKSVDLGTWQLMLTGGLRQASVEQAYAASLINGADVLAGTIGFQHDLDGVGPTIAVETTRTYGAGFDVFAKGRLSLLYGRGDSLLLGGEDLDLGTPLYTEWAGSHDDLLPVADLKLGGQWRSHPMLGGQFFVQSALEGSFWSGAGNASSTDGDLGFFGLSFGAGFVR